MAITYSKVIDNAMSKGKYTLPCYLKVRAFEVIIGLANPVLLVAVSLDPKIQFLLSIRYCVILIHLFINYILHSLLLPLTSLLFLPLTPDTQLTNGPLGLLKPI